MVSLFVPDFKAMRAILTPRPQIRLQIRRQKLQMRSAVFDVPSHFLQNPFNFCGKISYSSGDTEESKEEGVTFTHEEPINVYSAFARSVAYKLLPGSKRAALN